MAQLRARQWQSREVSRQLRQLAWRLLSRRRSRRLSGGYRDYYRPNDYRPAPRVVYRPVPAPYWRRGGYYYGRGYAPTYVVNDWGNYGLYAPPSGYYWRRSDAGDFLLVAITTGIITHLILNH